MKTWKALAASAIALSPLAIAAAPTIAGTLQPPAPAAPAESAPAVPVAAASDRVAVHYINVDQGSAALLEFPCGAILIDAGGRNSASTDHLVDYLDAFFARRTDLGGRLDAVFLTHNHDDHDRALLRVGQTFRARGYVHNGQPSTPSSGAGRMLAHAGTASPPIPVLAVTEAEVAAAGTAGVGGSIVDPLACARVDPRIRVLSGGQAIASGNPNNHSLVIRVDYGEASFLFTGDLEFPGIERLLTRYSGTPALDVDVYLAGHHGAENGTTLPFLTAMTPEMAVISMGSPTVEIRGKTAWGHGHPRQVAVELLEGAISRRRAAPIAVMVADSPRTFHPLDHPLSDAIYGTAWDGDIVVSAGADGVLQVATASAPAGATASASRPAAPAR